jgi:hypothetical protein
MFISSLSFYYKYQHFFCLFYLPSFQIIINNCRSCNTSLLANSDKTNIEGILFCVCVSGAWFQCIHLEPVHQLFFVKGFFKIWSPKLFVQAVIQLQSSWVATNDRLKVFFPDHFFLCLIEHLFRICASRCYSHSWWSMVAWITCHECDRIHLKIVLF